MVLKDEKIILVQLSPYFLKKCLDFEVLRFN